MSQMAFKILLNAGVHLEFWPDNVLFGKLQPRALTWYAVDLRSTSVHLQLKKWLGVK